jgi:hypothetical protein
MTHFAGISKPIAAAILMLAPVTAHAQGDDRGLAELLRECRNLADAGTRTACYDSITLDEAEPQKQPIPPPVAAAERQTDRGFGSNQLPRPSTPEPVPEQISARVERAVERQPGLYLLTLEDGTEWQFVDAAPAAYDPPRAGATIEISRASMGSYLIRYAGQRSVRARRVR